MLGLVVLAGLLVPGVAAAHSGAGTATDYRTLPAGLVDAAGERVSGARMTVHGGDDRLELRWDGDGEVVVLGYAQEPYLRLGPDGAFENARSPSVESNRERFGPVVTGESAGPGAAPEWRRISKAPLAVWHDHRSHWMSRAAPPASVGAAPDERQVVQTYSIPVRIDGAEAAIPGRLEYVPPPSPWAYVAAVLGLALIASALALRAPFPTARWLARVAAAAGIGAGGALLVADAVGAPWDGLTAGTSEAVPPPAQAGIWGAAIVAAGLLWLRAARRGPAHEAVVMLISTVILSGIAGLGRLSYLDHAVIPGPIPAEPARLLVVVCLAALPVPVAWAWRALGTMRSAERRRIAGTRGAPTASPTT